MTRWRKQNHRRYIVGKDKLVVKSPVKHENKLMLRVIAGNPF